MSEIDFKSMIKYHQDYFRKILLLKLRVTKSHKFVASTT